eukprot:515055-Pelagomonas_calceolata.AAC.5
MHFGQWICSLSFGEVNQPVSTEHNALGTLEALSCKIYGTFCFSWTNKLELSGNGLVIGCRDLRGARIGTSCATPYVCQLLCVPPSMPPFFHLVYHFKQQTKPHATTGHGMLHSSRHGQNSAPVWN